MATKIPAKAIAPLNEILSLLGEAHEKLAALVNADADDTIVAETLQLVRRGDRRAMTTSFIQKKYRLGFARASRIVHMCKAALSA